MTEFELAEQIFYSFNNLGALLRPVLELLPEGLYRAIILGDIPFGS